MDNTQSLMQCFGKDCATVFNPINPKPEMIDIHTIARALSHQCRFGGHVEKFLSVAQHSLIVSNFCDEKDALWGLLHDAAEAYLVDIPQPLKRSKAFAAYHILEDGIMNAVCLRYNMPFSMPESVKNADLIALAWEARDNLQPIIPEIWLPLPDVSDLTTLEPVSSVWARNQFLQRFFELYHGD